MFLNILESYPRAANEQAKAMLEERLWKLASPAERLDVRRSTWLNSTLPVGIEKRVDGQIASRHRLLGAPQILWDRINNSSIPIMTAVRLWREAEGLHRTVGGGAEQIVTRLLTEWDNLPGTRIVNGQVVKRKTIVSHLKKGVHDKSKKGNWINLRQAIGNIVKNKAEKFKIGDLEQQELFNWLEKEIMAVIVTFDARITRLKQGKIEITRRQVLQACHTLHVEPPSPGAPADMALAKRNKRRLLHEYHPDKSRIENAAALYQAVIEAFDTIEQYNKNLGG